MRLIDADALNEVFDEVCSNEVLRKQIGLYIDAAPTIDFVHYAGGCYCRECEYWRVSPDRITTRCELRRVETIEQDFCSYGDKKEAVE